MSRKLFRILESLGLSIFFIFLLTSTSLPATAHTISSLPKPSMTPLTVSTNVHCSADYLSPGWTYTGNGPAGFGCGGDAWETTTPTNHLAWYNMGTISGSARYHLNAFITNHANAPMNYYVQVYTGSSEPTITPCFYDQSTGIAWKTVCSFTVPNTYIGDRLDIWEQSGAVHSFTMSSSAIQLLPY